VRQEKDLLDLPLFIAGFFEYPLNERANNEQNIAIEARNWIIKNYDSFRANSAFGQRSR
jgi:hypothetical protein